MVDIDIKNLIKRAEGKMHSRYWTLGLKCEFILHNFKATEQKEYSKTEYICYRCDIISRVSETKPDKVITFKEGKYFIMIPFPNAWIQLKKELEKENCLKSKNIHIKSIKVTNWNWIFSIIHKDTDKKLEVRD